MSDMFFIIASVCIVVVTILLSLLIVKAINTLDEVNEVVANTNKITTTVSGITSSVSDAVATFLQVGAVVSPIVGLTKGIFRKKGKKKSK